jgi:hypothetical protein
MMRNILLATVSFQRAAWRLARFRLWGVTPRGKLESRKLVCGFPKRVSANSVFFPSHWRNVGVLDQGAAEIAGVEGSLLPMQ